MNGNSKTARQSCRKYLCQFGGRWHGNDPINLPLKFEFDDVQDGRHALNEELDGCQFNLQVVEAFKGIDQRAVVSSELRLPFSTAFSGVVLPAENRINLHACQREACWVPVRCSVQVIADGMIDDCGASNDLQTQRQCTPQEKSWEHQLASTTMLVAVSVSQAV